MWLLLACASPAEPPPPAPTPPPPPAPEPLDLDGPFRHELLPGLVFAAYDPPEIPDDGFSRPPADAVAHTDRRLFVVTVDLDRYELALYSALDPARRSHERTGPEWAERFDLLLAFNPGMYEPDGRATGLTRDGAFVSQPDVRRQSLYRSWFVADPGVAVLDQLPPSGGKWGPASELSPTFASRLDGYRIVAQSLSILRDGEAAYPPRKNQWSELAYGVDRDGHLVVVYSRFPYEMRELGRRIERLGIGVTDLLHGEGGPEATLVLRAGGLQWTGVGSYETGFWDDSNAQAWPLPSVMGVRPRAP